MLMTGDELRECRAAFDGEKEYANERNRHAGKCRLERGVGQLVEKGTMNQKLMLTAANAMTDFELTRSIIHDCPALRLPQSFIERLGMVAQIVVLKGASQEVASFIVDACNEKTERDAQVAVPPNVK